MIRTLKAAVRRRAVRAYFRSQALRELTALARWPRLRKGALDLAHLAMQGEMTPGSVQRDEALLLHGLVRVIRPKTVVEIGFLRGASAFNFLRALDSDAHLYSFDIDPARGQIARERFAHDPRLVFRARSQAELVHEDIDGHLADFVFLDASHNLSLNQATFERLVPI